MGNMDSITIATWRRRRNRWAISALALNWCLLLLLLTGMPGAGS